MKKAKIRTGDRVSLSTPFYTISLAPQLMDSVGAILDLLVIPSRTVLFNEAAEWEDGELKDDKTISGKPEVTR